MKTLLIYFGSTLAGGAVAATTVYGVVSSQTGAPSTSPASVTSVSIDESSYGSTQ